MQKNKPIERSTSELIDLSGDPSSSDLLLLQRLWTDLFASAEYGLPSRQTNAQAEFEALWRVYTKVVRGELKPGDFQKGRSPSQAFSLKMIAMFLRDFSQHVAPEMYPPLP